jgi:hypothetical protein
VCEFESCVSSGFLSGECRHGLESSGSQVAWERWRKLLGESPYRERGRSTNVLRSISIESMMVRYGDWGLSAKKRRRLVILARNCRGRSTELALQARRGIASRSLMGER